MNPLMTFGAGVVIGGVSIMFYGMFAPRWKPGDYTKLVNMGFNWALIGTIIMVITILSEIFFGGAL